MNLAIRGPLPSPEGSTINTCNDCLWVNATGWVRFISNLLLRFKWEIDFVRPNGKIVMTAMHDTTACYGGMCNRLYQFHSQKGNFKQKKIIKSALNYQKKNVDDGLIAVKQAAMKTFTPEHREISMCRLNMMTSSNGNIFRVTGHFCGECTRPRWIPLTKASDAELWCFLWSAPE